MPHLSPWQTHVSRWKNCTGCALCHERTQVVLARGTIPCDIIFIGEAPGVAEDTIGQPFVGQAGILLDDIIERSIGEVNAARAEASKRQITYCLTNLVACIPLDEDGQKADTPSPTEIMTCRTRLAEMVNLCRPKHCICVGVLSAKWIAKYQSELNLGSASVLSIEHPASILRTPLAFRSLKVKKCILVLAKLANEIP